MNHLENLTEAEVRVLRDRIYPNVKDSDGNANWAACKDKWMEPDNVRWLLEHQPGARKGEAE